MTRRQRLNAWFDRTDCKHLRLAGRLAESMVRSVSAREILEELAKLSPVELQKVHQRILELEEEHTIAPSAEFNAAISEGLRSLEDEPTVRLQEASQKIPRWAGQPS